MVGEWYVIPHLSYADAESVWEYLAREDRKDGQDVVIYRFSPPTWFRWLHPGTMDQLWSLDVVCMTFIPPPDYLLEGLLVELPRIPYFVIPRTPLWFAPTNGKPYDRYVHAVTLNDPNSPVRRYMAEMDRQISKGGKWATAMRHATEPKSSEWEPVPYSPPVKF